MVTGFRRVAPKPDVFRAIADPTRRDILDRLRGAPASVNAIAADFGTSRPAISKHLRVLREAGIVVDTPNGRERIYSLRPEHLQEVADWIGTYRRFWQGSLNTLKTILESER